MDQVGMTVLSGLQTGLSHVYQASTLRPLNPLASPSVSLHSQTVISLDHFGN